MSATPPAPAPAPPPPAPSDPVGARAPLFGHWGGWYALVVLELLLVIAVCGWLAARNG